MPGWTEIIDNSQEVTRIAQEQDAKLAQLRNLEQEAPQAIEALGSASAAAACLGGGDCRPVPRVEGTLPAQRTGAHSKTPTLLESNMVLCAGGG